MCVGVCVYEWCVLVCRLNKLDQTTHQHAPFTHAHTDTRNTPIKLRTESHDSARVVVRVGLPASVRTSMCVCVCVCVCVVMRG